MNKYPVWIDQVKNQASKDKITIGINKGPSVENMSLYASQLEPTGILYMDFLGNGLVEVVFKCGTIRSFNASEAWMN